MYISPKNMIADSQRFVNTQSAPNLLGVRFTIWGQFVLRILT